MLAKCGVPGGDERPVRVVWHRRCWTVCEPARTRTRPGSVRCAGSRRPALRDRRVRRHARGRLAGDPGYRRGADNPRDRPVLAAVFVAEIGDITRFARPEQLACWAGLTPKHHESDTHVHRGRITKQGSRLVRWAAVESVQILPANTTVGQIRDRIAARRGHNIGVVAAARRQARVRLLRAARPPRPGPGTHPPGRRHEAASTTRSVAGRAGHDPQPAAWSPLLIDPDRPSTPRTPSCRPLRAAKG